MFQDQSELILCSGSGIVTFVNAKRELKTIAVSNPSLEHEDPSLFKRLQYAKEVLVQMMSGTTAVDPTATLQQVLQHTSFHRDSVSPTPGARASSNHLRGVSAQKLITNEQKDQKSDSSNAGTRTTVTSGT